jgi:hypothetical protein
VSASSIPLKIKNAGGDLQEFTPAEEMYLSVKIGEALAESSAGDIGDISLTGDVNIGSFVDTYYNEPLGTHPASNITGTTVTTTLKQVSGSVDESGSDFARPVGYYTSISNPGFYEMVDADIDNLTYRALKNLETLGLQGGFRLSETSPGADWSKHIDSVFSNTLGDGTSTSYHIWKKVTLITPPTGLVTVRPVATDYDNTSSFNGFKEMSDAEIKYTLGQRAKSLRSTAGAIGSYQLRSSAQGAPTSAGTWDSRGSAVNTQSALIDQSYVRTRISAYVSNRPSTYSNIGTNESVGNFAAAYTGNSVLTFSTDYTSTSVAILDASGGYVELFHPNAAFIGNYVGNYARVSTRVSSRTRYSTYTSNSVVDFVGNFIGNYARTFTGTFAGDYTRNVTATSTRTLDYTRELYYVANFAGTYARTRVSTYAGEYTRTRISTDSFVGNYTRVRQQTFSGNFTTQAWQTYNYARTWAGVSNFSRNATQGGAYSRTMISTRWDYGATHAQNAYPWLAGTPEGLAIIPWAFAGDFATTFYYVAYYPGGTYSRTNYYSGTYSRTQLTTWYYNNTSTGVFGADYTRNRSQSLDYIGNYSRITNNSFEGNYSRTRVSSSTGIGTYTTTTDYVGNFTGNYGRTRVTDFTSEYTRERESAIVGEYITDYVSDFTGNYSRSYEGNYIGATISDTNTSETYTLYARVA